MLTYIFTAIVALVEIISILKNKKGLAVAAVFIGLVVFVITDLESSKLNEKLSNEASQLKNKLKIIKISELHKIQKVIIRIEFPTRDIRLIDNLDYNDMIILYKSLSMLNQQGIQFDKKFLRRSGNSLLVHFILGSSSLKHMDIKDYFSSLSDMSFIFPLKSLRGWEGILLTPKIEFIVNDSYHFHLKCKKCVLEEVSNEYRFSMKDSNLWDSLVEEDGISAKYIKEKKLGTDLLETIGID